jgi:Glycosyl transferase family 2
MTHLVLVRVAGNDRYRDAMRAAEPALSAMGHRITSVEVPAAGLPELSARDRDTWEAFKHTPEGLLQAWRLAGHVERATAPDATVVLADNRGLGGVLAVAEAGRADGERRKVWTIGGDSMYLRWRACAGTVDGIPEDDSAVIDWEIAQYRFSDRVFALSGFAAAEIAALGADPEPLDLGVEPAGVRRSAAATVWLPEPVSRLSQSATILRALAATDLSIVASPDDADDEIWFGTTWEATAPIREAIGDRLVRAQAPADGPGWVVLGDKTGVPAEPVGAARAAGAEVVVPANSTASALWPDAATWADEDDLIDILSRVSRPRHVPPPVVTRPRGSEDPMRARRVSVGVPVFRDVTYLDETMEAILVQTQPPHEVLLIDDGSRSPEVTAALAAWERRVPSVRALAQENRGVCVARNRLLDEMTGDAFLLVDSDDVLEPDFIARTAEALRANSRLWAVATWTRFFGEYDGIEAKPPFDARVGLRENPIVSTAALVDMAVRDRGVRFAPDMAFLYCEDWFVWSQIVALGGELGLVPAPLVRHRTHRASGAYQRTSLALDIGKARATAPLRLGGQPPPAPVDR